MISKEYFSYVDKISVWVHSYNTNGQFYIDGLIDGEWINILSEKITTTVKKKTLEASLDGKLCRQFRMYYVKAVELYTMASDRGHIKAKACLADCYYYGQDDHDDS